MHPLQNSHYLISGFKKHHNYVKQLKKIGLDVLVLFYFMRLKNG